MNSWISSLFHMATAVFPPPGFTGTGLSMFYLASSDLVEKLMLSAMHPCSESQCCCFHYSGCQQLEYKHEGRGPWV